MIVASLSSSLSELYINEKEQCIICIQSAHNPALADNIRKVPGENDSMDV